MSVPRSRRLGVALCVLLTPALSACDEEARQFAVRTAGILQQRSAELTRKIAAERKAYDTVAAIAHQSHRDLIEASLNNERTSRSIALAAEYDEGRKPPSRWQADLEEYAQIDYRMNRDLLSADFGAGAEYLQKLQALEIEQAKVDALATLLARLAKQPSLAEDLQAIGAFAEDTKVAFDTKVCAALAKEASAEAKAVFKARGCR